MKRLRLLKKILKETNADKIVISYFLFILVDSFVILLAEPGIEGYGDALWFCYEIISTTGFGELVAATFIGRICSVLLTVYSLLIIAIVTGVVTNYFMQINDLRNSDTINNFMDKLEKLPELSTDELKTLSENVKRYRQ